MTDTSEPRTEEHEPGTVRDWNREPSAPTGTIPPEIPYSVPAPEPAEPIDPACSDPTCSYRAEIEMGHLDVERLARALPTVFRALIPRDVKGLRYEAATNPVIDRTWANAIAAEYARLSQPEPGAAKE